MRIKSGRIKGGVLSCSDPGGSDRGNFGLEVRIGRKRKHKHKDTSAALVRWHPEFSFTLSAFWDPVPEKYYEYLQGLERHIKATCAAERGEALMDMVQVQEELTPYFPYSTKK